MSAERVPEKPGGLRLTDGRPPERDGVGAWLGVLERLLRLPAQEAGVICEELESHVRERVRDLVVTGVDEDEAVRRAVSELGDAAVLAHRYRRARALPRRRLMMNLSMLGLAGVLVTVGAMTLSQPGAGGSRGAGVRVSVFEPPAPSAMAEQAATKVFTIEARDETLEAVLEFVATSAGLKPGPSWHVLENAGVARDMQVTYIDTSATIGEVIHSLSDQVAQMEDSRLDYRIDDGVLRVATAVWFDRQETLLASYDISTLSPDVETEALVSVIHNYVHPSSWVDNGGDMAKMSVVGQRLFVQAPRRFHTQIEWFLTELSRPDAAVVAREAADVPPSANLAK